MRDAPDPRPGFYYVSVIDGPRYALLAGPYPTHEEALAKVEQTRKEAEKVDDRAIWYAFGTARTEKDAGPGLLNAAIKPQ